MASGWLLYRLLLSVAVLFWTSAVHLTLAAPSPSHEVPKAAPASAAGSASASEPDALDSATNIDEVQAALAALRDARDDPYTSLCKFDRALAKAVKVVNSEMPPQSISWGKLGVMYSERDSVWHQGGTAEAISSVHMAKQLSMVQVKQLQGQWHDAVESALNAGKEASPAFEEDAEHLARGLKFVRYEAFAWALQEGALQLEAGNAEEALKSFEQALEFIQSQGQGPGPGQGQGGGSADAARDAKRSTARGGLLYRGGFDLSSVAQKRQRAAAYHHIGNTHLRLLRAPEMASRYLRLSLKLDPCRPEAGDGRLRLVQATAAAMLAEDLEGEGEEASAAKEAEAEAAEAAEKKSPPLRRPSNFSSPQTRLDRHMKHLRRWHGLATYFEQELHGLGPHNSDVAPEAYVQPLAERCKPSIGETRMKFIPPLADPAVDPGSPDVNPGKKRKGSWISRLGKTEEVAAKPALPQEAKKDEKGKQEKKEETKKNEQMEQMEVEEPRVRQASAAEMLKAAAIRLEDAADEFTFPGSAVRSDAAAEDVGAEREGEEEAKEEDAGRGAEDADAEFHGVQRVPLGKAPAGRSADRKAATGIETATDTAADAGSGEEDAAEVKVEAEAEAEVSSDARATELGLATGTAKRAQPSQSTLLRWALYSVYDHMYSHSAKAYAIVDASVKESVSAASATDTDTDTDTDTASSTNSDSDAPGPVTVSSSSADELRALAKQHSSVAWGYLQQAHEDELWLRYRFNAHSESADKPVRPNTKRKLEGPAPGEYKQTYSLAQSISMTKSLKKTFVPGYWPPPEVHFDQIGYKPGAARGFVTDPKSWESPIFIVGFPRTGSTLLASMLGAHSQIALGRNSVFALEMRALEEDMIRIAEGSKKRTVRGKDAGLKPPSMPAAGEAAAKTLAAERSESRAKDSIGAIKYRAASILKKMHARAAGHMAHTGRQPAKEHVPGTSRIAANSRVVDSTLSNYRVIGLIHLLFPGATVLHMVRDPMDTLFSCYRNRFADDSSVYTLEFESLVVEYRQYLETMAHWREVLPNVAPVAGLDAADTNRIVDIQYRELVVHPEKTLRRVLKRLNLTWEKKVLKFHEAAVPAGASEQVFGDTESYLDSDDDGEDDDEGEIGDKTTASAPPSSSARDEAALPPRTISYLQSQQPLHTSSIGVWPKYAAQLRPLALELGKVLEELHFKHKALPFFDTQDAESDPLNWRLDPHFDYAALRSPHWKHSSPEAVPKKQRRKVPDDSEEL